jgi:hypothetical protein
MVQTDELTVEQVAHAQQAIEYCYERGWTDGLPVVPATPDRVRQFVEFVGRDGDEVLTDYLPGGLYDRSCTVETAAINAVMAGCLPEYFPVVLAALETLNLPPTPGGESREQYPQSTSGQSPLVIVNGPVRQRLNFNSGGNVFGPGYRANATVGRAIRLIIMNALGIRPETFDGSTQGTPSKYTFCIAENEEESPWAPFSVDQGFGRDESLVTALYTRSVFHVMNRESNKAEEVMLTFADAMSSPGTRSGGYIVVMGPQHAQLLAEQGWSKSDARQFMWEHWGRRASDLKRFGLARKSEAEKADEFVHFGASADALRIVVAGANSSGISAVVTCVPPPFHSKPLPQFD